MIFGTEPNETDLANHDDDWYEHTDSPAERGQCRTCAHNGCCDDLPYCGGSRWTRAEDNDD
jgi:hypothetical protein